MSLITSVNYLHDNVKHRMHSAVNHQSRADGMHGTLQACRDLVAIGYSDAQSKIGLFLERGWRLKVNDGGTSNPLATGSNMCATASAEAALAALRNRPPIIIRDRRRGGDKNKNRHGGGGGGGGGGGKDRTLGRRLLMAVGLLLVGTCGWLGWYLLLALHRWVRAGGTLSLKMLRAITSVNLSSRGKDS